MQLSDRIGFSILLLILSIATLMLVVTHNTYQCTQTVFGESLDCPEATRLFNLCSGVLTESFSSTDGNLTGNLVCQWTNAASIPTYISFAFLMVFLLFLVFRQENNPTAQRIGFLGGIMSAITSFIMLVEVIMSNGDYISIDSESFGQLNVSASNWLFYGNAILMFASGNFVFYIMKRASTSLKNDVATNSSLNLPLGAQA